MPDDEEMPPERAVEPSTLGARRCSREQFPEPGPRSIEARFDCFLADPQNDRCFGLADLVDTAEEQHFAQILRQLIDRPANPGELSPVGRRGIGPRTIACYVMRIFERERAGEKGAHLSPSCPVATFVERDTGDPCAEGAFAIIAIERRKAGDERLLRQIHRLVGIADLLYDEPVDARFVTAQQLAIGVFAVRARKGRQILVATLR
ncbi:hypothetical protein J2Y53_001972 [Sphingopyxis sp. BE122]|nr:hypothetical protein [Sphingopyxis sp. BE122]